MSDSKRWTTVAWAVSALLLGAFLGWYLPERLRPPDPTHAGSSHDTAADEEGLWTCGMHPHVLEHGPGPCPICGMAMVPVRDDAEPRASKGAAEREVLFYRNPMNPTITSPVPAKDEMGMDYIPVYAGGAGRAGRRCGDRPDRPGGRART